MSAETTLGSATHPEGATPLYRTIVADPPWDQGSTGLNHGPGRDARNKFRRTPMPYLSMSLDEIAALPVSTLAANDAHLYLWTTQRFLRQSFDAVEAWDFNVSSTLIWCKEPTGLLLGGAFAASVEFCHFCRRGNLPTNAQIDRRWFTWPRRKGPSVNAGEKRPYQGTKPEAFLDMVEKVSPGPYLELFARRQRLGWDTWGNEAMEHVTLPAPAGHLSERDAGVRKADRSARNLLPRSERCSLTEASSISWPFHGAEHPPGAERTKEAS